MIAESDVSTVDIVQNLVDEIRNSGLQPGDRLPSIRQFAARLGVRTHVVRDALVQAQTLGLVRIHPRSGAFVQAPSPTLHRNGGGEAFDLGLRQVDHHLFHLLEARQLLELELVQQAAKRRRIEDLLPVREALHAMNAIHESHRRPEFAEHDVRFHLAIARVAGNPVLASMLQSLLGSLRPFLNQLPFETDCRERTARSHFEIFRALVDGDAAEARDRMHDHLRLAYDNLLGEVQSLPGESAARAV